MIGILGMVFIVTFFMIIAVTIIIKLFTGTKILVLGKRDKRELVFGVFYLALLYIILSNVIALPMPETINKFFWNNEISRILGIAFCSIGILGFIVCVISFWNSVRIGIDYENAGQLTTTGIYAMSRNPMYTSFYLIFFGEFLIFPNIGLSAALIVAFITFHITILKEEKFLKTYYGKDYELYCKKVGRYF